MADGHNAPGGDLPPPPVAWRNDPTPLTMIAPAEALARVYAAAYLAERTGTAVRLDPREGAREAAEEAVRSFCRLCREKFEAEA